MLSPFEKGAEHSEGLGGIYLIKSPLTSFSKRGTE
jgi:hypothetical protein